MDKNGFSLIELLIVLAIIGLLTTLAYPSYEKHLIRTRRLDGQAALMDLANRMEHYYREYNTYSSATVTRPLSQGQWYQLSIVSQDETSFLLQATPREAQANDTLCQSLTLNHTGDMGIVEGPMGYPRGNADDCWK